MIDFPHVLIRQKSDPDILAGNIGYWALLARSMPPSFQGAGISHILSGPNGEYLGKVLPGKGIYLQHDLKHFGIRRTIPWVYQYSPTQRLVDAFSKRRNLDRYKLALMDNRLPFQSSWSDRMVSEIGAITTYDGIINARATGFAQDVAFTKVALGVTVANAWSSCYDSTGVPAAGTFTATPGAALNNASAGALSFGLSNPGSNSKYLLTFGYTSNQQINMLILADILVQVSVSFTTTAAQTVSSAALTRYTSGAGVLAIFEVTTALSSTAANMTTAYTGVFWTGSAVSTHSSTTAAAASTASLIVQRLNPILVGPFLNFASGDFGITTMSTMTLSAAQSAGVCGLNLYYPLSFVPGVAANAYLERDSTIQIDGLTQLVTEAGGALGCLGMFILPNGTTAPTITGFLRTCAG